MSEAIKLKEAWEETKTLWENEFKKSVTRADEEKKAFGTELGLTKEKIVKMEDVIQKYEKAWEEKRVRDAVQEQKLAAAEATILELKRLPSSPGEKRQSEIKEELRRFYSEEKAFLKLMRSGEERMSVEECKGLATDSDTAGGFLITPTMSDKMIELNVLYSPLRSVADVMPISVGDTLEIPKEGATAFTAQWVTERAARAETTAGTFGLIRIPTHELEANPWATQKMLDDAAINVEQYIAKKLGEQFGKAEGTAFINGSGVGKPQGLELGGSSTLTVTASDLFTSSLLIELQYLLEEPYASQGTWLAKRISFGGIRKLTAATDNFLWQPGLSAGEPPTLLGRPYVACNDIAVPGTVGDKVIYFGDFKAGYKIVDRLGVRVLRDPYTNKPNVEFTTYKRVGGQVVLPEAIKIGISD